MQQSIVSIRMDENLKQKFDYVCNELGLSISAAVTVFAKQVCREGKIPFEITLGEKYEEKIYMNKPVGYRVMLYTMEDFFEQIEKDFEKLEDALEFINAECDRLFEEYGTKICFDIGILNFDSHLHAISFNDDGLSYIRDSIRTPIEYDDEMNEEYDMYLFNIISGYIKAIIR